MNTNPNLSTNATLNIKPTNDLLLIRRTMPEQVTTSWGFQMAATEDTVDTPWEGVVVFAGAGRKAGLSGPGEAVLKALRGLVDGYPGYAGGAWDSARVALADYEAVPPVVPMEVKVGDRVVFSKNGYQTFKINGEVLLGMSEASVLGVLED